MDGITMDGLQAAEAAVRAVRLADTSTLAGQEFANAAAMLIHACRRGMWKLDATSQSAGDLADQMRHIMQEHRRLWLARNRPGGLDDSTSRLEFCLSEYQTT